MTKRAFFGRLAVPALAALLAACAASTPQFDRHFGQAARATLASQVARPDAAGNTDPVAGIDGRSARAVLERYRKSFTAPDAQPPALLTGAGGGR